MAGCLPSLRPSSTGDANVNSRLSPRLTPLLLALLPLLANAQSHDPAVAQDKITVLPGVEVTAQREATPRKDGLDAWGKATLHDTPAAVSVVGRERIEARQIRSLSELGHADAALGDNYAPVGYYQNLSIRGYALDLGTGYRNNNLAMTGEQPIALEDKQQVEILKGLAGLTAGVMEPGGVINFVSKRPADVRTLTLGADSRGSLYAALDVGSWLTPRFGLRANLAWESLHSFVQHANGRRSFGALAMDWNPTDRTSLQLDISHQDSAQRSASGYMLLGGTRFPERVDRSQMLGYQPWQQPVAIRATNASVRLQHAFNADWTLRLALGRSRSVIDDRIAFAYGCWYVAACAAGSPPNYFAPDGSYDVYDYRNPGDTRTSDEARATLEGRFTTGNIGHALTIGVNAFHRGINRHWHVNDFIGTANINDPLPPVFNPSPKQIGPRVQRLNSWQRSLFALDRLSFGPHWQLLLGARHVRLSEQARSKKNVLERDTHLSRTLPQVALLWRPDDALTVYASYGEGLSLGLQAPSWTSNDGDSLGPRLSRQIEAGLKYRWTPQLDFEAALYRIHQPYQYAQPDTSWAGFTFVERGEEVHTGLEVSAYGRLTDATGVHASLAAVRARAQGTGTTAFDGHQVVNVPRLRATIQVDHRLAALPGLTVQGGWRYASANPATPDGALRAPAYGVFNAGLRYDGNWGERAFSAQLGVDNLFNRFYWRDTGSSQGDNYLFPGAPRLLRLTLRVPL